MHSSVGVFDQHFLQRPGQPATDSQERKDVWTGTPWHHDRVQRCCLACCHYPSSVHGSTVSAGSVLLSIAKTYKCQNYRWLHWIQCLDLQYLANRNNENPINIARNAQNPQLLLTLRFCHYRSEACIPCQTTPPQFITLTKTQQLKYNKYQKQIISMHKEASFL